MSHYAVAVFSDDGDFDKLLRPYDENNEDYFEFEPVDFEVIEADFNRFKPLNKNWTLEMYINEFGYQQVDGKWGHYHNPHGYWDWYTLDGKDYLFDLKGGACRPENEYYFRKNDYDWWPDDTEAQKDAAEFWDDFIGPTALAEAPGVWNKKYFLERYGTKEQYVKEMGRVVPYAFITPDGAWHAPGRMGWFAISDESADDSDRYAEEWYAYLKSDINPYVSIVDCHI